MRAILLANATAATMRSFRETRLSSQRFALPPLRTTHRMTLIAPMISSLRMSHWPILLTPPRRVSPPLECCRGTKPSQAAKFRPLSKVLRSGAKAAIAPAVTGPMPGTVQSRRSSSSVNADLKLTRVAG